MLRTGRAVARAARAVHSETEIVCSPTETKTVEPSETCAAVSTEKTHSTSPSCSMYASDILVAASACAKNNGILCVLEMTCIRVF